MAIKFLNTATGITEAAGDNSTKIATTAYVDAAAGAVPIGNYLPLSAGSSYPLTGNLHIENSGAKIFLKDTTDDDDQAIYFQNNTATIEYVISTQDFTGAALGDGMFIGSVSSDELALVTSNTTALYIDTLQNVGIGTTNPGAKLHISDDSANQLYLERTGAITGKYRLGIAGATNRFYITDIAQGANRMVINELGNVGIGTDSPVGKLNVALPADSNGNVGSWGSNQVVFTRGGTSTSQGLGFSVHDVNNTATISSLTPAIRWSDLHYRAKNHAFYSNGSVLGIYQNNSGNVGIGNTNPRSLLNVTGTGSSGGILTLENNSTSLVTGRNVGQIDFYSNDSSSNGAGVKAKITAIAENSIGSEIGLTFGTSGTGSSTAIEAMRIDSAGNVGIGTDLSGGLPDKVVIKTGGQSVIKDALMLTTGQSDNFAGTGVRINMSGVSEAGSDIRHSYIESATSSTSNDHYLAFGTNSVGSDATERMRIDSDGNVGIGTDSPTSKLHVFGGSANTELKVTTNDNYIARLGLYEEKPGNLHGGFIQYRGESGDRLEIGSRNSGTDTVHMSIDDTTGDVGIGTDNPLNKLSIEEATVNALLKIRNTTNGNGAAIEFNDNGTSAATQNGRIIYYHSDGGSQGGGSTFRLTGEDDQTLVLANNGRVVVQKSGSSTEVGYGFYDDINTGMYRVGSDNLGFATGGVNRLNITNTLATLSGDLTVNGNVGIGTTNPGYKLTTYSNTAEVSGTNEFPIVAGKANAIGNFTGIGLSGYITGNGAVKAGIVLERVSSYGTGKLHILNNSTSTSNADATLSDSKITILGNGNVGIGTSSPTHLLTLETASSPGIKIKDTTQGATLLAFSQDSNSHIGTYSAHPLVLDTNSTERMRINSSGNVGIGTTDPEAKLHVDSIGTNYVARFRNSTGSGYAPGSILLEAGQSVSRGQGVYHYNNVADENWFTGVPYAVNSKKWIVANKHSTIQSVDTAQLTHALMTIDSDTGNVGIGTTDPVGKLSVKAAQYRQLDFIESNSLMTIRSTAPDASYNLRGFNVEANTISLRTGATSGIVSATALTLDASQNAIFTGSVGIGMTNPLEKLEVEGTMYATPIAYAASQDAYALKMGAYNNTAFDQGIKIKSTSTGQSYMSFNDRSEDALVLRGAKVGIGTDNPGYRLDVNGTGRFTSTVTATNFILSSDKRLKNNIKEVSSNHIDVNWKTFEMNSDKSQSRYGVIAQELEENHPEFVRTDKDGFKSVAYIDLLIAKIAELEARLEKAGI